MSLLRVLLIACALLAFAPSTHAALKIQGTPLIYFGHDREVSIGVVNEEPQKMLMQTWITSEDEAADGDVPFAVTEPLVQLAAEGASPTAHPVCR